MILSLCTSKLILSIFFVGTIVLVQFWAITSIIYWSVKKMIFLIKILKMADIVYVMSPWKLSPRSKFGGPKRTSRTCQEDGLKKKWKKISKGRILRYKIMFFLFFWNFPKLAILIEKFHCENSTYRKNGVHHNDGNGKSKKFVISDFGFSNFCHRDFSL